MCVFIKLNANYSHELSQRAINLELDYKSLLESRTK